MTKKVLITGATGFVGYHLIERALAAGLEVHAAVRPGTGKNHLEGFNIQYVVLDYENTAHMRTLLQEQQYNYIIHAAGITKAKTQDIYNRVNADYARNLATAAATADIPLEKFLLVSSLAAVGPLTDLSLEIQPETTPNPVTAYGHSKLLGEQYVSAIEGLPLLVIRPTAVYGPREKDLFILFNSINKGLEPHIGRFNQQISFVYVKDLVNIIVSALTSQVTGKAYNISDGHVYNRYALATGLKKALQKKTLKFHLPVGLVRVMASVMDLVYARSKETPALNKEKMAELTAINWACNIESARKDLQYTPAFDLEQGILATVKWYKANNWL